MLWASIGIGIGIDLLAKKALVLVLGIDLKHFGVLVLVLGIDLGPLEVLVLVLTFYKLVLLTSDRYLQQKIMTAEASVYYRLK